MNYLAFFGSSEGFTSYIFDSQGIINDFKTSIEERGLLESSVFTTDATQNKEILARYIFKADGRAYSLLKLYSFAQAANISRIDGCTYGVAIISNGLVKITKSNLDLLRVAKDNFAKLSLNGLKFNKSDFKEDVSRIWNAIVNNNNGNLLENIQLDSLVINNNNASPVSFFVKNLFSEAEKLNSKVNKQDVVYFSEDLNHLKRNQNKLGKDIFPIYFEQNNSYIKYVEPKAPKPVGDQIINGENDGGDQIINDKIEKLTQESTKLKEELVKIGTSLEKLKVKNQKLRYIIYLLLIAILTQIIWFVFFSNKNDDKISVANANLKDTVYSNNKKPFDDFLVNNNLVDSALEILVSSNYILSFDIKKQIKDTSILKSHWISLSRRANFYQLDISSLNAYFILLNQKIADGKNQVVSKKANNMSQ